MPMLLATQAQAGASHTPNGAKWFKKVLPQFTAPNVPAVGSDEVVVPMAQRLKPVPIPQGLPGKGIGEHSILYVGEAYNKIILASGGRVIWTYSTGYNELGELGDVWMLSNGNILFTAQQYVAEITPDKRVVWRYEAPAGNEIHSCQPIGLDKVMFIENGVPPHFKIINIKTKMVEVEHELPYKYKNIHGQFRRSRYTAQGTYLVSFLDMNRVVEYDKDFKEVWSYDVPRPWAAIRLRNGNTLITDEQDVKTIEVTPDKKIVWEISNADIPEKYRYEDSQSATRLANGDTVICSRGGSNHGPQLVEVTPDKKVVWVLWDWEHFGPATAVQILNDPGNPEIPGQSEH